MNIEALYHRHVDTVYRLCMMYMKNPDDAEDCVQNTFLNLMKQPRAFESEEHEKAWLIVTASNLCKNQLKHWYRKNRTQEIEWEKIPASDQKRDDMLPLILNLPEELKDVLYLHYYEGYSSDEMAKLLQVNASTLRSRLSKARAMLKIQWEEAEDER